MSGRYRQEGKTLELLDRLYRDKKRNLICAIGAAAVVYVLMLIFGRHEYLFGPIVRPPVMGGAMFFAAFLILGVLLALPVCSPQFMDLAELACAAAAVVMFAWALISGIVALVMTAESEAASLAMEGAGIWCAVCLIHGTRE